jgi:hypothetical protein
LILRRASPPSTRHFRHRDADRFARFLTGGAGTTRSAVRPRREAAVSRLGPQRSTRPAVGFGYSTCHDIGTAAFRASKALYESHYRGILDYAEFYQLPLGQKAFVTTLHLHDKFDHLPLVGIERLRAAATS